MEVVVLDTETTGDGPEDEMIELGLVHLGESFEITGWGSSLVRSDVMMKPEARAAHHIHPEDVAKAPPVEEVLGRLWARSTTHVVAHNAPFDRMYVAKAVAGAEDLQWICTWRCARHLWQNAPKFSNQCLRYWIGISCEPPDEHPHRALYDAWVTAHIFQHMLRYEPIDRLVELSTRPVLLQRVTFGKHKGLTWQELARSNRDYIRWILKQEDFDEDTEYTARYWWDATR
jgi:exodeoxyribonuclease X